VPLLQRNTQTFCAMILFMRGLADIYLDVRGGDIIVDLPGTSYTVTYHKPAVCPQLLAAYPPAKDDARTGLTQAQFLARAWRLANDKARELGWIA
jgi:hypothetical protein